MPMPERDRDILRDLARQVAEAAAAPIMGQRRTRWRRHNDLDATVGPMVLVFPEGAWRELLPDAGLSCQSDAARAIERQLRMRLSYTPGAAPAAPGVRLDDDTVVEAEWVVPAAVHTSGWGLAPRQHDSPEAFGAWAFDPVIHCEADLEQLRYPEVRHDAAETERRLDAAHELFDGLLEVRPKGVPHISFHLMSLYTKLRGLEQVFVDMVADPAMLHRALSFLEEGERRRVQQLQALNLLSLNNDGTYHSSGGNGYTAQLPAAGFDPARVRPADMWASAEAQELDRVSPAMHEEFSLQYERRLLAPFGLNGYGCCDDLTRKFEHVLRIPNLRRISIAPWADVEAAAGALQGDYLFSWKPQPTWLVGDFDADGLRAYLRRTVEVAAAHGCVLEMILKDTHTCEHHPERFTRWTQIAREAVDGVLA